MTTIKSILSPAFAFATALTLSVTLARALDLPIEVAVSNQTTAASVTVTVASSAGGATAAKLWMVMHNLQRDGQASVKINAGSWIVLSNGAPGLTVLSRGAVYGGIGGGYQTIHIDLALPASGAGSVVAGNNTIAFQINPPYTNGVSGFRVVDFNFRTTANSNLFTTTLTSISPGNASDASSAWIAANNSANINAGKSAWESASLIEYPGGGSITAKCSDCHTLAGRDLRYFGYYNQSIYKRARFHNLTDTQAKNLTRYIRSLTDVPTTESWGRPWNPPYQPTPGLGNRAVKDWAAGGGLGAVLALDSDMHPHLFPSGSTNQSLVDAVVNTAGTIKTFEIPIAMQFPDWNRWLPKIYPGDIWANFETGAAYQAYLNIRNSLTANGLSYYLANNTRKGELVTLLTSLNVEVRAWVGNGATEWDPDGLPGSQWRARNSSNLLAAATNGFHRETAKRSMSQWMGIKYIEIMREFSIEDKCPQIMTYDPKAQGELRGWPTTGQNVHANAPHITSTNLNNWIGQDPLLGDYLSTVWYHLQMALNAGQGQVVDTVQPQDWEYQQIHIEQVSERTGVQHPFRMVETMLKIYQLRDNQGTVNNGWMLRMCDPHRLFATRYGDTSLMSALDDYEEGLWVRVNNAFLRAFMQVVTNASFQGANLQSNPNNWPRYTPPGVNNEEWWKLETNTIVPTEWTTGAKFPNNHADGFWRLIPDLNHLGCDLARVTAFKDWCKTAWPGPPGAPNAWDSRIYTLVPTPWVWWLVDNVQYPGKRLFGDNLVGTNAILYTANGPRAQWMAIPVSGQWFRLQRQQYLDGVDYWLRAMTGTVPGTSGYRVEMGTPTNSLDQTQWRTINAGAGQYRIENKTPAFASAPWLAGTTNDLVVRVSTNNVDNSTKWIFFAPP